MTTKIAYALIRCSAKYWDILQCQTHLENWAVALHFLHVIIVCFIWLCSPPGNLLYSKAHERIVLLSLTEASHPWYELTPHRALLSGQWIVLLCAPVPSGLAIQPEPSPRPNKIAVTSLATPQITNSTAPDPLQCLVHSSRFSTFKVGLSISINRYNIEE